MICPMLSQSRSDREGNLVWDHHECIEASCTFWSGELSDCSIRASGLVVIARAKASMVAGGKRIEPGAAFSTQPLVRAMEESAGGASMEPIVTAVEKASSTMRDTGLSLLQGVAALEEPLKAMGQDLSSRVESLNAAVLSVTTTLEGRFSRVEEATEAMKRSLAEASSAKPAHIVELEQSLSGLTRRLGGITDRFATLSGTLETVSSQVTALRDAHEEISAALSQEAQRRAQDERRRTHEQARSLNSRGVALFYKGARQAAEASFRAALEMDPAFAEAHNNLGLALGKQEPQDEAEQCFRRALELDPSLAEAMNNLGFLFHQGMEFEKAAEMFGKSAFTSDDSSLAYTNLGNACYKMGKYSDAVDAWKKAIDCNPLNESAASALRMFQQDPRPEPKAS